jgi:hypothetical protein
MNMTNEEIVQLAHAMQQPTTDEAWLQQAIEGDPAVSMLAMLAVKLLAGKAYQVHTPDQEKVRRCYEFAAWFGATVEEVPQGSTLLGSLIDTPTTSLVITPQRSN